MIYTVFEALNGSTWARKPPRAGPMINPMPQAVLTWDRVILLKLMQKQKFMLPKHIKSQ